MKKDKIMKYAEKLKAMRVLFIDDDHLLRRSMGFYFRKKVSAFVALESAEQAFERIKEEVFDVVICDYKLPGMDGLRFLENLKESHPCMNRILISAFSNDTLKEEAKKRGVRSFIRKPFDAKEIETALVYGGTP